MRTRSGRRSGAHDRPLGNSSIPTLGPNSSGLLWIPLLRVLSICGDCSPFDMRTISLPRKRHSWADADGASIRVDAATFDDRKECAMAIRSHLTRQHTAQSVALLLGITIVSAVAVGADSPLPGQPSTVNRH